MDKSNYDISEVFNYFYYQLVNEIDNHAGLSNEEVKRLAESIKAAVKQTEECFKIQ